ncbi:outer membrane porin, OprD family [Pseudomonas sp. GM102]|uniref:OprD family porin n=1 Tax=Pseudomonas sp. GM102 TaxID=1144321 RepID=UPI00026F54B3|nr:OprD family porin [Pseudomonas sp. GM102]EJM03049.1 outer membrane porin, OprD family [Pseudomonas sp. GM102]
MHNNKKAFLGTTLLPLGLFAPSAFAAGFADDSHVTLQTSNFYMNRDFREDAGVSKREEWAQGFVLDFRSGYTPGTLGFGVDTLGMLGLKLDSSPDRSGTGLLPVGHDGRAPDQYSKFGLAAKVRVSKSELKVGTQILKYPTIASSTGRILPQTFQAGILTAKELDNLTFTFGDINRTTLRDYSHNQSLTLVNKNKRFSSTPDADDFKLGGADYAIGKNLTLSYQYGELDNIYRQQYIGLVHNLALPLGALKSDVRYYISNEAGDARAGKVDNRTLNALFSYTLSGHGVGLGYQGLSGSTAMPYVVGTDAYLTNYMMANDFMERGERSWQLRYSYDFAALGIPGLTFATRYTKADHANPATVAGEGREWERDTDLGYTVQSGALKNVSVLWRNAALRSNYLRDIDENRLIVSYTLPLF